jgi:arylsulfatase A-like enzyme
MSIRYGKWKFLDHQGSGGNNYKRTGEWGMSLYAIKDTAPDAPGQLYDLDTDPGETTNLYQQHPEIVKQLKNQLDNFKTSGRSAPLSE